MTLGIDHWRSQNRRTFSRRSLLLFGVQTASIMVLSGWYYRLQVLRGHRYRLLADENRVAVRLTEPPRGSVLDRNGSMIAANHTSYQVMLDPRLLKFPKEALEKIGLIVPMTDEEKQQLLQKIHPDALLSKPILVRDGVTWEQFAALELQRNNIEGLITMVGDHRVYPYGPLFAHLTGYVGRVSKKDLARDDDPTLSIATAKIGKTGIEAGFDKRLRGAHGLREIEVDALGKEIRALANREAKPGDTITMTLDIQTQRKAMTLLGQEAGSICVIDCRNGDILALASTPSFDPNAFVGGIDQDTWNALRDHEQTPLLNKSVRGLFSPGSTFKGIVLAAALAEGLIDERTQIYCPGFYEFAGNRFHCWKKYGHGKVGSVAAMAESCDVYFYELGEKLGVDRLARYARRFGLGISFDIGIPEITSGLVPTPSWKLRVHGERWYPGETINMSIGQGKLLTTPLQMAVMTARLATGKPLLPRITQDQPSWDNNVTLPQDHLSTCVRGMNAVVNSPRGTAKSSFIDPSLGQMAGKTGTVQVRRITEAERRTGVRENKELPWKLRDHAMFVGFDIHPSGTRYAMSVVVEHGGSGSKNAAPLAKELMEFILRNENKDVRS